MKAYRRAVLGALAALFLVVPVAQADPPTGAGAGKVTPFTPVGGLTAEDVVAMSFVPNYTGVQAPACGMLGRGDKVLFPGVGSTCTVKPGTRIVVPLPGASCSDAEPVPFYGATEPEQLACAAAIADAAITEVTVRVDGGPPQDVRNDRYSVITDQFSVISRAGNPFGATPGPTTLVVVGYLGVLRGLPPGSHTIVVSGDLGGPFTWTFSVNVVPGRGGR